MLVCWFAASGRSQQKTRARFSSERAPVRSVSPFVAAVHANGNARGPSDVNAMDGETSDRGPWEGEASADAID